MSKPVIPGRTEKSFRGSDLDIPQCPPQRSAERLVCAGMNPTHSGTLEEHDPSDDRAHTTGGVVHSEFYSPHQVQSPSPTRLKRLRTSKAGPSALFAPLANNTTDLTDVASRNPLVSGSSDNAINLDVFELQADGQPSLKYMVTAISPALQPTVSATPKAFTSKQQCSPQLAVRGSPLVASEMELRREFAPITPQQNSRILAALAAGDAITPEAIAVADVNGAGGAIAADLDAMMTPPDRNTPDPAAANALDPAAANAVVARSEVKPTVMCTATFTLKRQNSKATGNAEHYPAMFKLDAPNHSALLQHSAHGDIIPPAAAAASVLLETPDKAKPTAKRAAKREKANVEQASTSQDDEPTVSHQPACSLSTKAKPPQSRGAKRKKVSDATNPSDNKVLDAPITAPFSIAGLGLDAVKTAAFSTTDLLGAVEATSGRQPVEASKQQPGRRALKKNNNASDGRHVVADVAFNAAVPVITVAAKSTVRQGSKKKKNLIKDVASDYGKAPDAHAALLASSSSWLVTKSKGKNASQTRTEHEMSESDDDVMLADLPRQAEVRNHAEVKRCLSQAFADKAVVKNLAVGANQVDDVPSTTRLKSTTSGSRPSRATKEASVSEEGQRDSDVMLAERSQRDSDVMLADQPRELEAQKQTIQTVSRRGKAAAATDDPVMGSTPKETKQVSTGRSSPTGTIIRRSASKTQDDNTPSAPSSDSGQGKADETAQLVAPSNSARGKRSGTGARKTGRGKDKEPALAVSSQAVSLGGGVDDVKDIVVDARSADGSLDPVAVVDGTDVGVIDSEAGTEAAEDATVADNEEEPCKDKPVRMTKKRLQAQLREQLLICMLGTPVMLHDVYPHSRAWLGSNTMAGVATEAATGNGPAKLAATTVVSVSTVPGTQEATAMATLPSSAAAAAVADEAPHAAVSSSAQPDASLDLPNLGYACLNMMMREYDIYCSRDCTKKTFETKGLPHISQLALANARDIAPLIEWNEVHGIRLFRLSSCIFPWMSFYDMEDLTDWEEIKQALWHAGETARKYGHRLTFHPSEFVKIAGEKPAVVDQSIKELEVHSKIFDYMGFLPATHYNKINIHVGGGYGDKDAAIRRFAEVFNTRLSPNLRARLTVENDDRASLYSVKDLMELHRLTGIPVVFDFHHHKFCTGGCSEKEAFFMALSTWPAGVRPVVHWSESQAGRKPHAHSDYVGRLGRMNLHGKDAEVDVMIESKAKEVALLRYREAVMTSVPFTQLPLPSVAQLDLLPEEEEEEERKKEMKEEVREKKKEAAAKRAEARVVKAEANRKVAEEKQRKAEEREKEKKRKAEEKEEEKRRKAGEKEEERKRKAEEKEELKMKEVEKKEEELKEAASS